MLQWKVFLCFHSFMKLRINNIFSVIVLLFSKEGLKQPVKAVSLLKLEPKVSSIPVI